MKREDLMLIIELAPKLREAGVASVSADGGFTLRERVASAEGVASSTVDDEDPDCSPLDDPATFGIRKRKKASDR